MSSIPPITATFLLAAADEVVGSDVDGFILSQPALAALVTHFSQGDLKLASCLFACSQIALTAFAKQLDEQPEATT